MRAPRLPRFVIDDLRPTTPSGLFAKATVGIPFTVSCRAFRDGHVETGVGARLVGPDGSGPTVRLTGAAGRFVGRLTATSIGAHHVEFVAFTDRFATWRRDLLARVGAGVAVDLDLVEGAGVLTELAELVDAPAARRLIDAAALLANETCADPVRIDAALDPELPGLVGAVVGSTDLTVSEACPVWVDRRLGAVSAWYELFPRSYGGFAGVEARLDAIASMGFDVVYLPPIHPIGRISRKGPNNTLRAGPDDVGSPWAIGAAEGGHTAVHPDLGTIDDFDRLVATAAANGIEIALDYALQCSPDHPWVTEHPEWFEHRADGSIRHAENPPKVYEDIVPIRFWPDDEADRVALWDACRDIVEHWVAHGVKVFRVDNPHTKPVAFWQWLIAEVHERHPEVIFLAEAFTKPEMMARLAEIGFTQSYTYFTWRHGRDEIASYLTELASPPLVDYFRPNFWPNTPDILAGVLRDGPRAAFLLRVVLAATLAPSYGIYSGYELCENRPAREGDTEYLDSEKYQIVVRDFDCEDSIGPFLTRLNAIRRAHPAFGRLDTIRFHGAEDGALVVFSKTDPATGDGVLVVVNTDPNRVVESLLDLDLAVLGRSADSTLVVHDELSGETYEWIGHRPYVRLDPGADRVGHILTMENRP